MLISPDECPRDESDQFLNRAIRAASAEPIPIEALNRVIETAVGFSAPPVQSGPRFPVLERMLNMVQTHRGMSAAAATVVAAGALAVSLLTPSGRAYALDEIAKAQDRVTSYHVKITPANELGEAWVEINPDGSPRRGRWDLQSPEDGAKVVIGSPARCELWLKDRKSVVVTPYPEWTKQFAEMRAIADPGMMLARLRADEAAGKVRVETKQPARVGESLTLIVTPRDHPERRNVCEVDLDVRLMKRITKYQRAGERWEQVAVFEYGDYNKPIDPQVFKPYRLEDVTLVDQIGRKPGLLKGDLSEEEIAKKVVREFFEAVIARDYEKAGSIYGGMPGERIKRIFDRPGIKILRILEIGTPAPAPHPGMQALQVPVKIEGEEDGKRRNQIVRPFVRAPYGQPDRRVIIGGI